MSNIDFDESCSLCAEINAAETPNNLMFSVISLQTELKSRVITESEHFVVIPTIGAFVEGYVLIVSKAHFECMGKIPVQLFPELERLTLSVKEMIQKEYGSNSICFEHGGLSCTNLHGGCIAHAHLHIVPCDTLMINEICSFGLTASKLQALSSLHEICQNDTPYLYFEDIDKEKYYLQGKYIPSQFFRQIMARYHGRSSEWDWRQYFFVENMEKTMERMSGR